MKEFQIYIRRPPPMEIFISSIPYRDGVAVVNKLILHSNIDNLQMEKALKISAGLFIGSSLEDMTATVMEMVRGQIAIQSDVAANLNYQVETTPNLILFPQLDLSMTERKLFHAQNAIGILTSSVEEVIKSPLGSGAGSIVLFDSLSGEQKISKEQVSDGFELVCGVLDSFKTVYEAAQSGFYVDTPDLSLFYKLSVSGDSALCVTSELKELEVHYSLGDGKSEIVVSSGELDTLAEKKLEISNQVQMTCDVDSELSYFSQAENQIVIDSQASAITKRYRLLCEVDDWLLSDMDDMTLQELDYVILEE